MEKVINNYTNYIINENGDIYSLISKRYLKPIKNGRGYLFVGLSNKSGRKKFAIHRLVAQTFIPNPNNFPVVNHKDENKLNNCVDNLEWCTVKYNTNYGMAQEKRLRNTDISKYCKPVLQFDIKGNLMNRFISINEACRTFGFNDSYISKCCKGKKETAYGYVWKYERSDDLSVYQY